MARKKLLSYPENVQLALKKLPNPIEDRRHNLFIFFPERRVNNKTRLEYISIDRNELQLSDIKRITKGIRHSICKVDKRRKGRLNIYILKNKYIGEYIKIPVQLDRYNKRIAYAKTLFVTTTLK